MTCQITAFALAGLGAAGLGHAGLGAAGLGAAGFGGQGLLANGGLGVDAKSRKYGKNVERSAVSKDSSLFMADSCQPV